MEKWDLFRNLLLGMQNNYNINNLPDHILRYVLQYDLPNPKTPDRVRRQGLKHVINALNVVPGQEPYNIFDRINRPEVLLDLYDLGYNPYILTQDGIALHQTKLNIHQWMALLRMPYDLCTPGVDITKLSVLPNLTSDKGPEFDIDLNGPIFSLIVTVKNVPDNISVNLDDFEDLIKNAKVECDVEPYLDYIDSIPRDNISDLADMLLEIISNWL